MSTTTSENLREQVRERYAAAARAVLEPSRRDSCCSDGNADFGESLYNAEQRGELPDSAVLASLGCGNPTAVAELHEGETVLDLGSGGGIDVILSAKRVGSTGVAYGLDMTDEMLALAQKNAQEAGVRNVHFLKGVIEAVPLPAESVDVVISNCVVNLADLADWDAKVIVTPDALREAGIVTKLRDGVKILGSGDAPKGLHFRDVVFSAPARAKLEAVGAEFED
jgi:SAM-dependent methyltransferase